MCAFSELAFEKPALKYPPPTAVPLSPAPRHWSANTGEPRPSTVERKIDDFTIHIDYEIDIYQHKIIE